MLCNHMIENCKSVELKLFWILKYITGTALLFNYYMVLLTSTKNILFIFAFKGFVSAAGNTIVKFVLTTHKVKIRKLLITLV